VLGENQSPPDVLDDGWESEEGDYCCCCRGWEVVGVLRTTSSSYFPLALFIEIEVRVCPWRDRSRINQFLLNFPTHAEKSASCQPPAQDKGEEEREARIKR